MKGLTGRLGMVASRKYNLLKAIGLLMVVFLVTAACGEEANNPTLQPAAAVTRAEMAVFLIRALDETPVDPLLDTFSDVPASHFASGQIERLFELGITVGCSSDPLLYCPNDPTTRAEMAVFLIRALEETPVDPLLGTFSDVPASHFGAGSIERLFQLGVTMGCASDPLMYCLSDSVTREQMARLLVVAFDLPVAP